MDKGTDFSFINRINKNISPSSPMIKIFLYHENQMEQWSFCYLVNNSKISPNLYDWLISRAYQNFTVYYYEWMLTD